MINPMRDKSSDFAENLFAQTIFMHLYPNRLTFEIENNILSFELLI